MSSNALKALALEGLFIGAYFLLREYVQASGNIPKWLAWGFVTIVVLDIWAVWFKLRAVRSELHTDDPVLPAHIVIMTVAGVIRVAIFGVMVTMAYKSIQGQALSETGFNILITALVCKELLILFVLSSAKLSKSSRRPSAYFVFLADIVLVLSSEFVLFMLDELFVRPSLDLAWNPIFLIVMIVVYAALFLAFLLPFRILYSFESLRGSQGAIAYELGSIGFLVLSLLWFSLYNSDHATEHFVEALNAQRGPKFAYEKPTRLKNATLTKVCRRTDLRSLELRCDYLSYLPPCIYALPNLEALDLRDNQFKNASLDTLKSLKTADLSGNAVRHLRELGLYSSDSPLTAERLDLSFNVIESIDEGLKFAPDLVWLDLSHNPLQDLKIPQGSLKKLRTLRLQGTLLSEAAKRALQHRLPNTKIEF